MSIVAGLIDGRVKAAVTELSQKTLAQIEAETALTWAARAGAAFVMYAKTKELKWALDGRTYEDEAQEHAAMAGGKFCEDVRQSLSEMRQKAGVP